MRLAVLPWLIAMAAVPTSAAVTDYGQCVALVQSNPASAEEGARTWGNVGGGPAAMHCRALALVALKRYPEAARLLDSLARQRSIGTAGERADLFDQAGNAWLLAGLGRNAAADFSEALVLKGGDIGVLADRARARAVVKDWKGADADLSAALLQDQNRADLLVLRASARWAQGNKTGAATDIVRALELYPNYPPALLERGRMKYSVGDERGARADWKKAAATAQGETALEAKRNLEALGPETTSNHPR